MQPSLLLLKADLRKDSLSWWDFQLWWKEDEGAGPPAWRVSTELSSLVVFLQGRPPDTADFALRAGLPQCPVARDKIPVLLSLMQQSKPAPCPLETPESLCSFHFWAAPSTDGSSFLHFQNNPFDGWLLSLLVIILCPLGSPIPSHPAVLQIA